ncbi:MAG: ABC transporter permease [Oscillospiraceae bacterium]|nr:ABC transporter permease [Oscillospiraceae bacterium]
MDLLFSPSVLASAFRIATPLLLAALGCILCHKAGITNLAIESFMLVGSFVSIACITLTNGSVLLGILAAMVGAGIYSLLFALAVVKFKANHVVASIAMNMLGVGLTSFLLRSVLGSQGMIRPDNIQKIPNMRLNALEKVPIIGSLLHSQSFIVPLAILLALIVFTVLKKTKYGLNVVSLGESEDAARAAGIKVDRVKWSVIIISGIFCGLAGAYLSTTILSEFSENMIQGRGFTAYTAVIFGGANPIIVWVVAVFFGWAEAVGVQIELVGLGIPTAIVKMFPYVLAIIVLIISSVTGRDKDKWKLMIAKRKERKSLRVEVD